MEINLTVELCNVLARYFAPLSPSSLFDINNVVSVCSLLERNTSARCSAPLSPIWLDRRSSVIRNCRKMNQYVKNIKVNDYYAVKSQCLA